MKKQLHNIFLPRAQKIIDTCDPKKTEFDWEEFYEKFDKELVKDMKSGDWKKWKI